MSVTINLAEEYAALEEMDEKKYPFVNTGFISAWKIIKTKNIKTYRKLKLLFNKIYRLPRNIEKLKNLTLLDLTIAD